MIDAELYLGDCFDHLPTIPDGSVDMVLTDMPYGTTANHWDAMPDLQHLFAELLRVCKDNAALVMFSSMPFTVDLVSACRRFYRYEWVWDKHSPTGFLNCRKMPMRRHETLQVFYKRLPTYNPQFVVGKPYAHKGTRDNHSNTYNVDRVQSPHSRHNDGRRYPCDIIDDIPSHNNACKVHPTQKPVPLCEYMIKTYTNEGETVLDPFMGAGTTGVACANTGREFVGCELLPKYYDVARERIDAALVARLSEGGET